LSRAKELSETSATATAALWAAGRSGDLPGSGLLADLLLAPVVLTLDARRSDIFGWLRVAAGRLGAEYPSTLQPKGQGFGALIVLDVCRAAAKR
jgi:hypothetical protein